MRGFPLRSATLPRILFGVGSILVLLQVSGCGGSDGNGGTAPEPPTVLLTAPTDGATVSGAVEFRADASRCERVRFLVDDVAVAEDEASPYSATWNSGSVSDGAHVLKAVAEGAGGSATDLVTFTVHNDAGTVLVSVSPPSVSLAPGEQQQFSATVTGAADTRVTWTVEGSAAGTITPAGLYTAPATPPSPSQATIRATSVADPSRSGTAAVTLIPGGGGVTAHEREIATRTFHGAREVADLGVDGVALAAEAVWGASELNGGTLTLTGTLTQAAPNSESWSYTASPSTRLVVAFSGGPTFELGFTEFDGYLEGTWEDFTEAHKVDFTLTLAGQIAVRIRSDRYFTGGAEVPYTWRAEWTRQIDGTVPLAGGSGSVAVTHTGTQQGYNEPGFAGLRTEERILGEGTSSGAAVTLDEYYYASYDHNSTVGHVVRNWQMTVNSSLTEGGTTYAYDTASARWEASSLINDPGAINSVREPSYWRVMGVFRKNGTAIGNVTFDGPVLVDTNGPNLVLDFGEGAPLVLHTLVPGPGE